MPRKKATPVSVSQPPDSPKSTSDGLEPHPETGTVVAHQGLTLLEVADSTDLTALMLDARLKPLIFGQLSPTQALVLPQHHKSLLETLKKAGHTPKVLA
jgi:hypothetical protein